LVQQPLQGFVQPWLEGCYERYMLALAQEGYDGIEVSMGEQPRVYDSIYWYSCDCSSRAYEAVAADAAGAAHGTIQGAGFDRI
jgi:hypothetical protein